jgi:hypothetical protein
LKIRKLLLIIFIITIIITISITFTGCNSSEKREIIGNNSSEEVKENDFSLNDDVSLIKEYENRFKEYLPNMEIVAKEMADLDNDNEEDMVIIYVDPSETTRSNICFITKYGANALDFSSNEFSFVFANDAESLKILESPIRVCVILREINTNDIYEYHVIMETDKDMKLTNFKVENFLIESGK